MHILLLLILLTTACAARTGTATIVYRSGDTLVAHGIPKPTVGEGYIVFDSEGKMTITPMSMVFGVYWIEE